MKTIWKYPLVLGQRQTICIPKGFKILTVQEQHGVICLWAEVIPPSQLENVIIKVVGTGHAEVTDVDEYLGTVQTNSGLFVWHIYRGYA